VSRRLTGATAVVIAFGLMMPATAPAKVSLSSLNRSLNKLRGDLQKTRAQLVALQKLHNQLLVAHNNVVGCLERGATADAAGYQFNNGSGLQSVFGNFFVTLAPGAANTPFPNNLHHQWTVGVKNNAFCLSVFGYRDPHTSALAAKPALARVSPFGFGDGAH